MTDATTPEPAAGPSRAAAGIAASLLAVLTLAMLFRGSGAAAWIELVFRIFTDGLVLLAWVAAAGGIGFPMVRGLVGRAGLRDEPMLWITASIGLGIGGLSLAILLLGLAGWLSPPVAWGMLAVGVTLAIVGIAIERRSATHTSDDERTHARSGGGVADASAAGASWWGSFAWLPLVPVGVMTLVAALVPPGVLWSEEPHPYDVLSYHLQVPREWYELGRIVPLEHNVFSHFPFNVEMHFLLAMHLRGGAWAGMYLAQLMHAAMVAIVPIAVFAALRSRGRSVAMAGAVLSGAIPWMLLLGGVAYNEGGLLLFATLATIVASRAMAGRSLRLAILAGACAGLACGAKLTAAPTVLLAVPVAMLVAELIARRRDDAPRGVGRVVALAAVFVAAGMLAFSPWLVRNAAWAGNPVFPERMEWLGRGHFDEAQVERWRVAHSPRDDQRSVAARLEAFVRHGTLDWRSGHVLGPIVLLAIVAAAMARTRESLLPAALLVMLLSFWLLFTHLQGRFLVFAIPLAALTLGSLSVAAARVALLAGVVAAAVTIVRAGPELSSATPVLGLDDLAPLARLVIDDERLADRVFGSDAPVVLVGDAQAFLYPIPMSRLSYRTVFDVPATRWIADVPAEAIVIRDAAELERLRRTYRRLPEE